MAGTILIIAPHPDDEVLGCGGIIRKFSESGDNVHVLIVTRGNPDKYPEEKIKNIRQEALTAHKVLGVKETHFFDFYAPDLDMASLSEISSAISGLVKKLNADTLFLPHRGDIHNDHRVVFNAGLVAARPVGEYSVKSVYAYETLSETEWAAPYDNDAFIPNHFVDITAQFDAKSRALSCYKSQLKTFPYPRSPEAISALASLRGSTIGVNYAEAFMTIRTIQK